MLWAKLLLPVVMVVGGLGAAAFAYASDGADGGPSQVWIDGPGPDATVAPGTVQVSAHATASSDISAMELYVDDQKVATDRELDTQDSLSFAAFSWPDAREGEHRLVVRQVGGTGAQSATRFVSVAKDAPLDREQATTTDGTEAPSTTEPGSTTSTTSSTTSTVPRSETTTTLGREGITTAPPNAPVTTPTVTAPPVTAPPVTAPPVTKPPTAKVVIDSAALSSGFQNRLYVQGCGYTVQVSARIQNADYADAVVQGTGVAVPMTRSGGTWTATLTSGALFDSSDVGTRQVMVVAGRGDEVVDRAAGTVTIIATCPKE